METKGRGWKENRKILKSAVSASWEARGVRPCSQG